VASTLRSCALLGFASCVLFAAGDAAAAPAAASALEPVTVTEVVHSGDTTSFTLNVASGGCTRADDFRVVVAQEPTRQTVRIVRLRIDACEAFAPRGAHVVVKTKDVAADKPAFVENPLFVIRER
jgi:hypothetical protein